MVDTTRPLATSRGPAPPLSLEAAVSDRAVSDRAVSDSAASAVEGWRTRATVEQLASRPTRRARWTVYPLGVGFILIATAFAVSSGLRTPPPTTAQIAELLALTLLYAVAYRLEFAASAGSMVPTQPVLVAMLFTGRQELVPAAVVVGILLAGIKVPRPDQGWYGRAVQVMPAWHSVAPAAILVAFSVRDPSWSDWPVLVLALAAQFAVDAATATARMASLGVRIRVLIPQLGWTFGVDTLMAVVGAGLAFSVQSGWPRVLLAAVPVVLVGALGHDRRRQVEATMSLGAAYDTVSEEATHDAMTGLANRRGWDNAVAEAALLLETNPGVQVCVIAADLDGLKHTNDTYGHETGDALIVAFARLLAESAPPGAVAARLGGDEFALLVVTDEPMVGEFLVGRLRGALGVRERIHGLTLSASLGWAACPPAPDLATAVRAADDSAGLDKHLRRANRRAVLPT